MKKLFFLVVVTAALMFLTYCLRVRWGYDLGISATVVGLVGVAAAIVSLLPEIKNSSAECKVSNAWFNILDPQAWEYKFHANLINSGTEPDVLEELECTLYKGGELESVFVAGAKEITKPTGHVLPFSLHPHITYEVEGVGTIVSTPESRKLIADQGSEFILHCKFVFAKSRPILLRLKL
jgi:hypothetical protein